MTSAVSTMLRRAPTFFGNASRIIGKACCLREVGSVIAAASAALLVATAANAATLTLYSAQHEQVIDMIDKAFTAKTGIQVRVHSGEPPELAAQIVQEGSASPADVFFTANSPELVMLDEAGLLAKLDPKTLAKVPARFSAPDSHWLGVLAREDVLAYNTTMIQPDALPGSLLDLAEPQWKRKVAIAPTDADFLPLVSAVLSLKGRQAALDWLAGLKANAQIYNDNEGVMASVDRGTVATGIINNYYWARLRTEEGATNMHSEIHHFADGDVGALVNISGAAVLASSRNEKEARAFLAFLVSRTAQDMIAQSDISYEYPLVPGVAANSLLRPFDELHPAKVSLTELGDDKAAVDLLRQAGLL